MGPFDDDDDEEEQEDWLLDKKIERLQYLINDIKENAGSIYIWMDKNIEEIEKILDVLYKLSRSKEFIKSQLNVD